MNPYRDGEVNKVKGISKKGPCQGKSFEIEDDQPQNSNEWWKEGRPIHEAITKGNFNLYEMKFLMAIWEQTYGFERRKVMLTLTRLSQLTGGISKSNLCHIRELMIDRKIIVCRDNADGLTYRINKKISEWKKVYFERPSHERQNHCLSGQSNVVPGDNGIVIKNIEIKKEEERKGDKPPLNPPPFSLDREVIQTQNPNPEVKAKAESNINPNPEIQGVPESRKEEPMIDEEQPISKESFSTMMGLVEGIGGRKKRIPKTENLTPEEFERKRKKAKGETDPEDEDEF
jgi:hypothetical protein